MEESSPITPELRDNLVAYLDGELDEVATLEVERTLSESAEIRQEVEALSRTWDLLAELPRVEASNEFTERTLASLEASEEASDRKQPLFGSQARRNLLLASLLAGAILCAAAGFLFTNRAIPQRTDPLVKDLPVIEQLDLYEEAGDLKFLTALSQAGTLAEDQASEVKHADN